MYVRMLIVEVVEEKLGMGWFFEDNDKVIYVSFIK